MASDAVRDLVDAGITIPGRVVCRLAIPLAPPPSVFTQSPEPSSSRRHAEGAEENARAETTAPVVPHATAHASSSAAPPSSDVVVSAAAVVVAADGVGGSLRLSAAELFAKHSTGGGMDVEAMVIALEEAGHNLGSQV